MIEFALLFGLGFLTAVLLTILVAPAIHSRIVRYTENRIKATLPISLQEVRAQRDMARAVYAADNARTMQELIQQRDKAVSLQLQADKLTEEARRLRDDNDDLRSRLAAEEEQVRQMKAESEANAEKIAASEQENDSLRQRQTMLMSDADNLRIDLTTRDMEVENLRLRISGLREERDQLRSDARLQTTRAKDAEMRLAHEESRVQRLEEKLAREMADRADKEAALERRAAEIAQLREKLKSSNAEARATSKALRDAAAQGAVGAVSLKLATKRKKKNSAEDYRLREPPLPQPTADRPQGATVSEQIKNNPALAALAEHAHSRATVLSERLLAGDSAAGDNAAGDNSDGDLRLELATIAADMVALTAAAEGTSSPIRKILSGKDSNSNRESLAARAKQALKSLNG